MREKLARIVLESPVYPAAWDDPETFLPLPSGKSQRGHALEAADAILEALAEPSEAGLAAQRIERAYFVENLRLYLKAAGEE